MQPIQLLQHFRILNIRLKGQTYRVSYVSFDYHKSRSSDSRWKICSSVQLRHKRFSEIQKSSIAIALTSDFEKATRSFDLVYPCQWRLRPSKRKFRVPWNVPLCLRHALESRYSLYNHCAIPARILCQIQKQHAQPCGSPRYLQWSCASVCINSVEWSALESYVANFTRLFPSRARRVRCVSLFVNDKNTQMWYARKSMCDHHSPSDFRFDVIMILEFHAPTHCHISIGETRLELCKIREFVINIKV